MANHQASSADQGKAAKSRPSKTPALQLAICGGVLRIEPSDGVAEFDLEESYLPFVHTGAAEEKAKFSIDVKLRFARTVAAESECTFESEYFKVYRSAGGYRFDTTPCVPQISWDCLDRTLTCSPDFLSGELIRTDKMILPRRMYPLYSGLDRAILGSVLPLHGVGFLAHSSAVRDGEGALLFLGISGKGKSTMARIWVCQTGATVLSDEFNGVCRDGSSWLVCGTPWPSAAQGFANESLPLKGALFLEHGPVNEYKRLSPGQTFTAMLAQALVPHWCPEAVDSLLDTVSDLSARVPTAILTFRPDEEVVSVIREFASET